MMMRVRITTPRPVAARPSATPRRRTIHNAVVAHKVTLINKDTGATIMGDARKDEYLLDVADRLGADIPCVCRSGTCASCAVQVVEGNVEYEDLYITVPSLETLLSEEEIAQGLVPSCRSRAISDVVLAYSEAGLH